MIKETEDLGVMQGLLKSFADEGWKVDEKGKLTIENEDGESSFYFVDYSNFCTKVEIREIALRRGLDTYRLMEYPLESRSVYVLVMPPIKGEKFGQEEEVPPVLYNSEGELNRSEKMTDLPRIIDMEKTVDLFLNQVIDRNFSKPVLIEQ